MAGSSVVVKGDSTVKFGIKGATQDKCGVVESISITKSYETTVEARNEEGDYKDSAAVTMRGEKQEVSITGFCKSTDAPKVGDTLTFDQGENMQSDITGDVYVTSCDFSASVGDFVKVTISGITGKDMGQ